MKITDSRWPSLTGEQKIFLNTFFQNCPDSFLPHMMLRTYPNNHTLIHTDDACSHVYILLRGRLQAVEERTENGSYQFGEILPVEIIGDFELFSSRSSRMITLTTLEPSLCMVIPSADYLQWIRQDANALFLRIRMLINQMSAQSLLERQLLFWDNQSRMIHYLFEECTRQKDTPPPYSITATRAEIAGKLGCSVRTANRIIKELADGDKVGLCHGKIQISDRQYKLLKELISQGDAFF